MLVVLRCFITSSNVRSPSDWTQFAFDLASDLFTPNRSAGRASPDYFGGNQWYRAYVSGEDNHSLVMTSKESQLTIKLFHYRVPLSPVQRLAVSWVNIVA